MTVPARYAVVAAQEAVADAGLVVDDSNAEEVGVNIAYVEDMRANSTHAYVRRMLGVEGNLNEGVGLSKDWAYNIIKQVGNYGEIYDAYMGDGELGIRIAREGSANALWTKGGLMYAPPFR